MILVRFMYLTGVKRRVFRNARLAGSWNGWLETHMEEITGDDGCPAFTTTVEFDDSLAGQTLRWGVRVEGPQVANAWAINLEVPDPDSSERYRELELPGAGAEHEERYHFTYVRRLGANKLFSSPEAAPDLRFSVWAPNAKGVEVVFATADRGYVADDGTGIDPAMPVISLERRSDGLWESEPIADFSSFVGVPYMFRIDIGAASPVYRTDIYSRWQLGRGDRDPARRDWDGDAATLDGTVSCSVVIDQDVVRKEFEPTASPPDLVADREFWESEFTSGLPVATRVEDLVIYELHVGSLGFPSTEPGTLADAMGLLDQLGDLGVNAVELLPLSEFSGDLSWGYGDSHHLVIESSAGGRDKYKHFVRECHRRGIAVIQDACYNHFDLNAARAEWQYDSTVPEENIYYWYEGSASDYPNDDGGYLNNGSTGFTPRFWEEPVRQVFISSAVQFVEDFHVDGFRVDLTQAIHRDNSLNADGRSVGRANQMGQKFLREWSRTLRMVRPSVMLIAEDHTEWPPVTEMPDVGGLGFDATWFAQFYHHLIGDSESAAGTSRLIREAGFGDDRPLAMDQFATRLAQAGANKVVYHESHDEAGNAPGTMRTSKVAVDDAPLEGPTRDFAEARCRVAFGLSVLSAGTPMFLMGEEIVAQKLYKHDNVAQAKEDLLGERAGDGARMFRFYQDLIRFREANRAVRSHNVDVVHVHDLNRVIAFTRWEGTSEVLVVASLNNRAFAQGYVIETAPDRLVSSTWLETFNSDAPTYGGAGVGNFGGSISSADGRISVRIPANGFIVLQRI